MDVYIQQIFIFPFEHLDKSDKTSLPSARLFQRVNSVWVPTQWPVDAPKHQRCRVLFALPAVLTAVASNGSHVYTVNNPLNTGTTLRCLRGNGTFSLRSITWLKFILIIYLVGDHWCACCSRDSIEQMYWSKRYHASLQKNIMGY